MINVRTTTLKKYISDDKLRLSAKDRVFLDDLARVGIIDIQDAENFHYKGQTRTPAAKRMERLCEAGLLEKVPAHQPGRGKFDAYQFKSDKLASLFGGKRLSIGSKRNALHEVITSKLYFKLGRPESFVTENRFDNEIKDLFRTLSGGGSRKHRSLGMPDAIYKDGNDIIIVEADSGQYTKSQVDKKQTVWQGYKQVWGQPSKSCAKVEGGATVYAFS